MIHFLTNLFGIGRATLVDDAGEVQLIQLTERANGDGGSDLVTDKIPRVSEFGFASNPPIDSEVLVLRRGAERSRSIAIGTSHRPSRPRDLAAGDVALYDVRGAKVTLTAAGLLIDCAGLPAIVQNATDITLKASGKVRVEAATLEVTGDVKSRADGAVVSLNGLRDAYAAHKHGGVQTGSGLSGLTDHAA